jgi:ParB family chromosome partitioning protein
MARPHLVLEHALDEITVGHPYRRDLGNIRELADSIDRIGLLHPITLTPSYVLISGNRRLAALRLLGRTSTEIWIVPGVSDKLSTVLAIQDENALQKALTPIEQAELYAELKALYAQDAARRDSETRFGSPARTEHLLSAEDGAAESAAPQSPTPKTSGEARTQAARAVTGRDSRSMLEQVVELQRLAADDDADPMVRQAAAEALLELNQDGKVNGRYLRVKLAQHTSTLARMAEDPNQAEPVRAAARAELAAVQAENDPKAAVKEAALAVARVEDARNAGQANAHVGWADADPHLREKHEVRKLVDLLRREHGWWDRYDPNLIGQWATDEQWELIRQAAAGASAFITAAQASRSKPAA